MTQNKSVLSWIEEMKALVTPDNMVWIDGSEEQIEALREEACSTGEMMKLTFYHQATGESREINVKLMEDTNQQSGYNL